MPPIAEARVELDPVVSEAAEVARFAMERFDEGARGPRAELAGPVEHCEATANSEIEMLSASARRIALAALGEQRNPHATSIVRNIQTVRTALAMSGPVDSAAILAMHEALGGGDDPRNAGRFRDQWVWVGGASPVTAQYVAPRHEDVAPAIADLVAFVCRTDVEPLTQAAIAHAQFETIHPFSDGNGRVGRALVAALLRYRDVTTSLVVPLSSGLLPDIGGYVDALAAYREGDCEPVVTQFATAAKRAVHNATRLHDDVEALRDRILATAQRGRAGTATMAELCCSVPAFTVGMVVERGLTEQNAYRLCDRLTAAGVLRRERLRGGVEAWTVAGLTEALDAFADRARLHEPEGC